MPKKDIVEKLNLSPIMNIKPMSERFIDIYWDNQIKKAKELAGLNILNKSKLNILYLNSWKSLAKSAFVYIIDLPKNFYKTRIYDVETIYVSPLEAKNLSQRDKTYKEYIKN